MLVVMQQGATERQIEIVIARMVEMDFNVHRSTGVIHTLLGGVGGREEFDLASFEVRRQSLVRMSAERPLATGWVEWDCLD